MEERAYRLGVLRDGAWSPVDYQNTFGPGWESALVAAPASHPIDLVFRLMECGGPYFLIRFELLEPHGMSYPEGRFDYASPLSRDDIILGLKNKQAALETDARLVLDLRDDSGMRIRYDEHNQVLLDGPLAAFEQILLAEDFRPGNVDVPFPHAHHYRDELTPVFEEWLQPPGWIFSPAEQG